jgi:hypothetical protein
MRFTVSFLICQYFQSYNLLRDPAYGFDDEYTPDDYMSDVSLLASRVLFWPPVMEHCRAGRKYDLSRLLDHSADTATRTSRPETRLLKPSHGVPRGWVLKREASSGSNHVYLPGTRHAPQKVKRDGPYRWIAQEYMPLLHKLGEFRVICVDLEPVTILHTVPAVDDNNWTWAEYSSPYSLSDIQ